MMEAEEEPTAEVEEQKVTWVCSWKHPEDENDPKSVMLLLGHAAGANNDLFEIYADDDFKIQENSPLTNHELVRVEGTSPRVYRKELELTKASYQFLFVIENMESIVSAFVSDDYLHTKLVSGRTVNYIELDGNFENEGQGKDAFADISETSPLVSPKKQSVKKAKGGRCGCGPKNCSVL